MPDLAKLREQIAREIDPHAMQSHEQWLEQARAAALDLGASPDHPEIIRLARDNFVSMEGRREQARAKAGAILFLLRPALQEAWEDGRDDAADAVERMQADALYAALKQDKNEAVLLSRPQITLASAEAVIRALTPPDYLTGGDDAR